MKQPKATLAQTFLVGFLMFILILGAYFFPIPSKPGTAGETTSWNAGTDSCTITAGATSCTKVTTWATPLAAAPCGGCSEAVATTSTGGISDQTILGGISSQYFFDEGNDFVNGKWTNMPAAKTEIFGENGAHWLIEDWSNVASADFVVNCHVNSNTAGATLNMEYSTDFGATWASVGLSVDINGFCGPNVYGHDGPGDTCFTASAGASFGCFTNIPAGAKVQGVFLRIVGNGGGGVGDVPDFTLAYVNVKSPDATIKFIFNVGVIITNPTQISVNARISVAQSSSTTISWKMSAWICKTGGSGPC